MSFIRNQRIIVFEKYLSGHRQSYANICKQLLKADIIFGEGIKNWTLLIFCKYLIVSSCDDWLLGFTFLSIARSFFRKKTIGIAISVERCINKGGLKNYIKLFLLRILKIKKDILVLSIIPYSIEPRLQKYTSNWIFDPQYWDLSIPLNTIKKYILPVELLNLKSNNNKLFIGSIGKQSMDKGFALFCQLWNESVDIREKYLFFILGDCSALEFNIIKKFKKMGGIIVDRYLSNDELLSVYNYLDIIWSCYAPEYDQSSGIFGRALQFQKTVIIRSGSYLEKILIKSKNINIPYISLEFCSDTLSSNINKLIIYEKKKLEHNDMNYNLINAMKDHFINITRSYFNI